MWPPAYREFAALHALPGKSAEIPEESDLSGLGADINLFTEDQAREEANGFYPGLVVKAHGFVPIGGCAVGSGDPYFVNVNDPEPGPVYRIYHDSVADENYDREAAIVRVLETYRKILDYLPD